MELPPKVGGGYDAAARLGGFERCKQVRSLRLRQHGFHEPDRAVLRRPPSRCVADRRRRALTVTDATGITTNTYATDGLRQRKVVGSTTSNYLWDASNIAQESNASLVVQARNTDLPGIWGGKFSQHRGGPSNFYLPDFQGNTRQLADINQAITDTLLLDAWGREIASTGTTVNPFRYQGQYGLFRDVPSRVYVRARHLDVVNGRWISRDPIGLRGGDTNYFRYVINRPLVWSDPTGLTFTNAQCRAACDATFTKNKDRQACYDICNNLGGSNCGSLRARCNHLERHPREGSATTCWALYTALCNQPKDNPAQGCNPIIKGIANCSDGQLVIVCIVAAACIVVCARPGIQNPNPYPVPIRIKL